MSVKKKTKITLYYTNLQGWICRISRSSRPYSAFRVVSSWKRPLTIHLMHVEVTTLCLVVPLSLVLLLFILQVRKFSLSVFIVKVRLKLFVNIVCISVVTERVAKIFAVCMKTATWYFHIIMDFIPILTVCTTSYSNVNAIDVIFSCKLKNCIVY